MVHRPFFLLMNPAFDLDVPTRLPVPTHDVPDHHNHRRKLRQCHVTRSQTSSRRHHQIGRRTNGLVERSRCQKIDPSFIAIGRTGVFNTPTIGCNQTNNRHFDHHDPTPTIGTCQSNITPSNFSHVAASRHEWARTSAQWMGRLCQSNPCPKRVSLCLTFNDPSIDCPFAANGQRHSPVASTHIGAL